METLLQDVRFGVRMLIKAPLFSAAIVLTLALGLGANTAIFSIVNATLLRPVAGVVEPERMVLLGRAYPGGGSYDTLSYPNYVDFRDQATRLAGVAAYHQAPVNVSHAGETIRLRGNLVTPNYFSLLGLRMVAGRALAPTDDVEAGPPVAVISEALWRRFGAPASLLGGTLVVNAQPVTVVGIAPRGFYGVDLTERADLWMPLAMRWVAMPGFAPPTGGNRSVQLFNWLDMQHRGANWLLCFARLKPGVRYEEADAEVRTIAQRLAQNFPDDNQKFQAILTPGIGLDKETRDQLREFSGLLFGAAVLLLLLACANVANLLLSRAVTRRRELAIRLALGAARARLVRQVMTEGLLLAAAGGLCGILVSVWVAAALVRLLPVADSAAIEATLDWHVMLFTAAASLFAGLMFGFPPSLLSTSPRVLPALKSGTRQAGSRRSHLRSVLVVAQLALSLVLLVGAGLLVRTMRNYARVQLGFDDANLVFMEVDPSLQRYDAERMHRFETDLLDRLRALPGVRDATLARVPPVSPSGWGTGVRLGSDPRAPMRAVQYNIVAPNYFEFTRIPIVRGRGLSFADIGAPSVAVINEPAARAWFPGQDPLGRQILVAGEATPRTIVGVAAVSKYRRLLEPPRPFLFLPMWQSHPFPKAAVTIHLRSRLGLSLLTSMVAREVRTLDASLPIYRPRTLTEQIANSIWQQRLAASFITAFAALALLLGVVGVYAVLSYAVSERTHEMGVRLALGAQARDVLRLVLTYGTALATVGAAIGTIAALLGSRVLKGLLYGVEAADPLTYLLVAAVTTAAALAASYFPARRATRVDPMVALRYE